MDENYEQFGIKSDDLLDAPLSDDERMSLDYEEAGYMNAWHDNFDDYDANSAF